MTHPSVLRSSSTSSSQVSGKGSGTESLSLFHRQKSGRLWLAAVPNQLAMNGDSPSDVSLHLAFFLTHSPASVHGHIDGCFSLFIVLIHLFLFFFALAEPSGMWVAWPGIKPVPPPLEAWTLNYWATREVSCLLFWLFPRTLHTLEKSKPCPLVVNNGRAFTCFWISSGRVGGMVGEGWVGEPYLPQRMPPPSLLSSLRLAKSEVAYRSFLTCKPGT